MSSLNLPGHPSAPPPGCPAHPVRRTTGEASAQTGSQSAGPLPEGTPPALYGAAFADDPDATYRRLRRQGPANWVELAPGVRAVLVTGYDAALEVVRSPYFSKDARRWRDLAEGRVAPDNEVLPMMAWRPSLLFADGERHLRLRKSIDDALARVDPHRLREYVEQAAHQLIRGFGHRGRADLVSEYADRLPTLVFAQLFGAPEELVHPMAVACDVMMDAEPSVAQRGGEQLAGCIARLVAMKRQQPGADMTTRLLEHETGLTDDELIHQHVVLIGAGTVPQSAWIAGATLLLLTDSRFSAKLSGGSLTTGDALNEVLWNRSPLANFCFHYTTRTDGYPLRDPDGGRFTIPPGVPVLISHEAANTDPVLSRTTSPMHSLQTNQAHLAFSAGPHVCPAQDMSGIIAEVAIETLLDELPEIELDADLAELSWRPGPFHRSLSGLPVRFPALPASEPVAESIGADCAGLPGLPGLRPGSPVTAAEPRRAPDPADPSDRTPGDMPWTSTPYRSSTPPEPTSTPKPPGYAPEGPRRRWSFRRAWWHGR